MNQRIANLLASPDCPQNCSLDPLPKLTGSAVIECRDVHFSYHDGAPAVEGVSFSIQAGEKVALLGPNGSGKTTLLKLITGLLEADQGSIQLAGRPLDSKSVGAVELNAGQVLATQQGKAEMLLTPGAFLSSFLILTSYFATIAVAQNSTSAAGTSSFQQKPIIWSMRRPLAGTGGNGTVM